MTNITIDEVDQALVFEVVEVSVVNIKLLTIHVCKYSVSIIIDVNTKSQLK